MRPRLPSEAKEQEVVEVLDDGQTIIVSSDRERKQYVLDHIFDARKLPELENADGTQTPACSPPGSTSSLSGVSVSIPSTSTCFRQEWQQASQAIFFNQFGLDFVQHALKGYNICMFAYGHTGSGKTYTMLGDDPGNGKQQVEGLLPRFLRAVFMDQQEEPSNTWRCTCEMYEVYNEQVRDLLQPSSAQRSRRILAHPKHGIRIEGLASCVVSTVEEVLQLLSFAGQTRTASATASNSKSSRSHAFFSFKYEHAVDPSSSPSRGSLAGQACTVQTTESLTYRRADTKNSISGASDAGASESMSCTTMTFVDLAGREDRMASAGKAVQYREMCFINTSLFHLAHLITKISTGQLGEGFDKGSLSDFRNSKVTLLLSQALSGNCKTAVIATLSPLQSAYEDSISTLNFAASAKKVQTRPMVNRSSRAVVNELEAEVRQLQKELAMTKTRNLEKEQELVEAQAWISHYRRSWEEAMAQSDEMKKVRNISEVLFSLSAAQVDGAYREKNVRGPREPQTARRAEDPEKVPDGGEEGFLGPLFASIFLNSFCPFRSRAAC